jgi:hypothetical protein
MFSIGGQISLHQLQSIWQEATQFADDMESLPEMVELFEGTIRPFEYPQAGDVGTLNGWAPDVAKGVEQKTTVAKSDDGRTCSGATVYTILLANKVGRN